MNPVLAQRYLQGLRAHLRQNGRGNGDGAQGLGRAALAAGMAPVDLAVMHEKALTAIAASPGFSQDRTEGFKRKAYFFTQALIPLEAARETARRSHSVLQERNATLRQHTLALARANRSLQSEVVRRKAGEQQIRKGKEHYRTLFLESQAMQKKLRKLTHQIISAQEDERKEISRELHDEVVQTLVGINVELAGLGRGAMVGVRTLKAKIAHTQKLVENSVNAVHQFARELRPAVLDDLGLIPALVAYSKNLTARKHLKIQMTAFAGVEALGAVKRTVLFRVAQEALTNVVRHARATLVKLTIREIAGGIRMDISDNGKSFQVRKTLLAKNNKHLGLIGMRERVAMVGGHLTLDSVPGTGTTVRAEIPFPEIPYPELQM